MDKTFIVPSDKLRVVTVHKLQAASCQRKYFWQYIMNLEPKGLRIPLWFGSMVHAGIEARLLGKTQNAAILAMMKVDREITKDLAALPEDLRTELRIWRAIGPEMVAGCYEMLATKGARLVSSETKFAVPLFDSVTFCGTIDGIGIHDNRSTLFEFKTAGQISKNTFSTMAFNKQVYGYLSSMSADERPKQFAYCVMRKPSKWLKRGQSVEEFIEELRQDFRSRPEFYYAIWLQEPGQNAIKEAHADIYSAALDLGRKYRRLKEGGFLHDPPCWPRNDRQCHDYGNCPFLELCKDVAHWQARANAYYQQREIRYELERQELATKKG